MKIRQNIPTSQLIDDNRILVRPGWLLAGMCLAGAARSIEPPFEVFYPPSAEPFGAGWSLARFLSSSWAAILILFMLGGGILGDIYGRRRTLLWGLGLMLVANIALLFSPNTLWYVLWNIPANISAGIVIPLTLAPLYIFFTGRQRAIAFTIYITVVATGELLSIYQGKLLAPLLDWRGFYLIPTLITLVAIYFVRRSLPESRTADPRTIQAIFYTGWTILVLGLLYGLFGLVLGRDWLTVVIIITLIVLAVAIGLIFWWWRKDHHVPLRNRYDQIRHVVILIVTGAILQISFRGFYSLTYSYYRVAQNHNFLQTLLSMSPMFLGILATAFLIFRLWVHQRIQYVIAIGFLVIAFSVAVMALVAGLPYWVQILPLVIFGISIIATKTIWTNAFFQILIDRYIGLNAGMNSATLLVGSALGGVISTELLARFGQSAFVRQSKSLAMSEGALKSLFIDISQAISTGERLGVKNLAITIRSEFYSYYQEAYISGYSLTILVIALFCLLAAAVIFRGIQHTMIYQPENTPLHDESNDGEPKNRAEIQDDDGQMPPSHH